MTELAKKPAQQPALQNDEQQLALSEAEVMEWLRPIEDPEIHMSLVDLGLIYKVKVQDSSETGKKKVDVQMTLTTPSCPAADYLVEQVRDRLKAHSAIAESDVELVWEPKWDPKTMASEEAKEILGIW